MKPRFSPSSVCSCVKMADPSTDLPESDFACLLNQKNSENTKHATKVAHNVFWEYLKEKNWRRVTRLMKKKMLTTVKIVQMHRIRKCGNPCFRAIPKLQLIDKRIQFAIQEEQLYAECGARLKNFYSSSFLCICPSLFETDLNKAKYSIYEKLLTVFSVAGFCFEAKYSHQL